MAKRVSPNRMELMRLEERLAVASRGHKLLKDKRDGLMRIFIERIENTVNLRKQVDELLGDATSSMAKAQATLGYRILGEALMLNAEPIKIKVNEENIMSLAIPQFDIDGEAAFGEDGKHPYGLANTSYELDIAMAGLKQAFPALLKLAAAEKEIQLMSREIETTRRRVNSLEFFMIPQMRSQIREISMKMEEAERENISKLMKVKDDLAERELEESREAKRKEIEEYRKRFI